MYAINTFSGKTRREKWINECVFEWIVIEKGGENMLWQGETVLFAYDYLLLTYWYSSGILVNFKYFHQLKQIVETQIIDLDWIDMNK